MGSSGCMSMFGAKSPVYERMETEKPGSVVTLDMTINSFWYNRYVEATIDGFAVTDRRYLPKGKAQLQLDAGSHELCFKLKKRTTDIGPLPKEPLVCKFTTLAGGDYCIKITKKRKGMLKVGIALDYKGWSADEASQFPREYL